MNPQVQHLMQSLVCRKLEEGMVITVEPGCYFGASLLEPALKDPAKAQYLDADALAKFKVVP